MAETTRRGVMHTMSLILAGCNGVAVVILITMLLVSRNGFAKIYNDFGTELAKPTLFILVTHWFVWIVIAIALLSVVALTELIPVKRVSITMHLTYAILGVLVASGVVYLLWARLPAELLMK